MWVGFGALAVALSLAAGGELGNGRAGSLEGVFLKTRDVAVRSTGKAPLCKKGQKSTKRRPCGNPAGTGWTFGFALSEGGDGSSTLTVTYSHRTGKAIEVHSYTFLLRPNSLTVAPDLSSLTLDTGTQLGRFGAIKMTFANPGSLAPVAVGPTCSGGKWQARTGMLEGALRFAADRTYFRTLVESSLPAKLSGNTSGEPQMCGHPPPTCIHDTFLSSGAAAAEFYASVMDAKLSLVADFAQTIAPAQVVHALSATGLAVSGLTVAPDLSSGTLAPADARPAFTGSLDFTGSQPTRSFPNPVCGANTSSSWGTVSGDLVAHFTAIPAAPLSLGSAYVQVS